MSMSRDLVFSFVRAGLLVSGAGIGLVHSLVPPCLSVSVLPGSRLNLSSEDLAFSVAFLCLWSFSFAASWRSSGGTGGSWLSYVASSCMWSFPFEESLYVADTASQAVFEGFWGNHADGSGLVGSK